MPRTKKNRAADAALPSIPSELIDQVVKGPMSADAINAASKAFKKALIERCLGAELSHHLGYSPGAEKPEEASNHRSGTSAKTVLTEDGPLRIDISRDGEGSFDPVLIPKHERRFTGFDDKIIAMYARGMTVREIQGFLTEQYGPEVSPECHRRDGRGDGRGHRLAEPPARAPLAWSNPSDQGAEHQDHVVRCSPSAMP